MPRSRRQQALNLFRSAVAYGDNRSAVTFALADAGERGEALTLAEAHSHTDVHSSTVRKILQRLTELELVEETSKDGRLAFRFTQTGMLGYRAWQEEEDELETQELKRPPASALYRWRVKGYASRAVAVDADAVRDELAAAGLELIEVAESSEQIVPMEYEVDAADEQEAMLAARRAGWAIQGLVSSAERVGLADGVPVRDGHALEFKKRDTEAVRHAITAAVREHCDAIRSGGAGRADMSRIVDNETTVCDFLQFVDVPENGRVELPDDERLIDAVGKLWGILDEAGVRAVGEAFMVSEREIRERYAGLAQTLGDAPGSKSWDDIVEESLDHYRRQQRLVP